MTARCQLCSVTVLSNYAPMDPEDDREKLIEYDRLSAYMWLHISENHPMQVQEGILVQQRAAKMYAMNWADTEPAQLLTVSGEDVKRLWRSNLLMAMSVTTRAEDAPADQAAGEAEAPGPSPSPSSSATSSIEKERNSDMKDSI